MTNPWIIAPLDIALRLLLALLLGGAVGLEREQSNHAAGFRTHILVCIGSCLIMLLSIYGFSDFVNEAQVRVDPSRLAAQVISGIGFLGAGAIVRNGLSINGLTTAASLWVVAAIGLSVGAGFYYGSVIGCTLVLFSLWFLNILEKRWLQRKRKYIITIMTDDQTSCLASISTLLNGSGVELRHIEFRENQENAPTLYTLLLTVKLPKPQMLETITTDIVRLLGKPRVSVESL
ncbi:magnesium transporter MgtC [Paenibacillus sp. Soil766]|uniref:MgtC/SapB family protein n=1 Tax=Paenibacillus sp. Soil766 TaxID=1736404 RepID=UPI00070B0809|nr:MgtC/SapB family protein [Paenibacillus sp. Soil766]KRF10262.1 magnesium transporter MgtC [Paenibacillus sp. Soil766]